MDTLRWTPDGLRRLTLGFVIAGTALLAGPAVAWLFGPRPLLPSAWISVPLAVSAATALWTWLLCRALLKFSTWHFLWLGPLFGALNAGTTLSLLSVDEGLGAVLQGFLLGSLFGAPAGGILGLFFGGLVTASIAYYRRLLGKEPSDAGLRLVAAGAAWWLVVALAAHGLATGLAAKLAAVTYPHDYAFPPEVRWAAVAAKALATAFALAALVLHLRTLRWTRGVRAGAEPSFAVLPATPLVAAGLPPLPEGPAPEVLVRREAAGSGPFRQGAAHEPLGYLASPAQLQARAGATVALAVAACMLWLL